MSKKATLLALVLATSLVACSSGAGSTTTAAGPAETVAVSLDDLDATTMALTSDPTSVAAGKVTFEVTNNGYKQHELAVFKTDLAVEDLPTNDAGSEVLEGADGMTLIGRTGRIKPGETASLTVTLEAGDYALVCNIKGHYDLGMSSAFTVS